MSPPDPIVHIVDDDESFRHSTARLVRALGYTVETYGSGDDFLARARRGHGCLLLDVRMPGSSGLELQQALTARGDLLPIVFLTGHGDIPMSVRAMRAGAEDFLTKPVPMQQLKEAIDRALARDAASRVNRARVERLRARYDTLTPAEKRIFAMVVTGMLNKQIAYDLNRAERTVKAHRSQVMTKMQAESVADLVRMADELGVSRDGSVTC
jgi:FixJ family two-component response regulator